MPKNFKQGLRYVNGTAIRDFIQMIDIVRAYLASVKHLSAGGTSKTLNIDARIVTSVYEIVSEIPRQTGSNLFPNFVGRRAGDIGIMILDPIKAEQLLELKTKNALGEMIASIL